MPGMPARGRVCGPGGGGAPHRGARDAAGRGADGGGGGRARPGGLSGGGRLLQAPPPPRPTGARTPTCWGPPRRGRSAIGCELGPGSRAGDEGEGAVSPTRGATSAEQPIRSYRRSYRGGEPASFVNLHQTLRSHSTQQRAIFKTRARATATVAVAVALARAPDPIFLHCFHCVFSCASRGHRWRVAARVWRQQRAPPWRRVAPLPVARDGDASTGEEAREPRSRRTAGTAEAHRRALGRWRRGSAADDRSRWTKESQKSQVANASKAIVIRATTAIMK